MFIILKIKYHAIIFLMCLFPFSSLSLSLFSWLIPKFPRAKKTFWIVILVIHLENLWIRHHKMQCRTLHIALMSGKKLKKVTLSKKMDIYASVSIFGDINSSEQEHTPARKWWRPNPMWNFPWSSRWIRWRCSLTKSPYLSVIISPLI